MELGYTNPSQPDNLAEPCTDWEDLEIAYKEFDEYKGLSGFIYTRVGQPFVVTLDKILS